MEMDLMTTINDRETPWMDYGLWIIWIIWIMDYMDYVDYTWMMMQ